MSKRARKSSQGTSKSDKWVPHEYQRRAIEFCVSRGAAGVFADPGTGKTTIMATTFQVLREAGLVERALVVAPLQPCYNVWSKEHDDSDFVKWSDFRDLRVQLLHGRKKEQALETEADLYVINPEGLHLFVDKVVHVGRNGKKRREYKLKKQFRGDFPFDMLVVDESTDFKHSGTDRFKRLEKMLDHFSRRYILTGTPVPNGLEDLFGQVYVLDGGRALGRYITHYRSAYFMPVGYGGFEWALRPGAEEEIYEALEELVVRIDGDDELELPPLVKREVRVDLPDAVAKQYAELSEEFLLELKEGDVTAYNAGTKSTKLRQIANGGVYLDPVGPEEKRRVKHLHDEKVQAVQGLLEELGGKPALIAYEYNHDLERLKKALGKDTPHLGKGVTKKQSQQIQRDWNAGKIPALLCQPQSMSRGLNLQGAGRAVVFHSLTWNYEHYDQLIRRVWRQGQRERVFVYHVVARDTVDDAVLYALRKKRATQQALLDALKEYYLRSKK